jgi:hypothetical protein
MIRLARILLISDDDVYTIDITGVSEGTSPCG